MKVQWISRPRRRGNDKTARPRYARRAVTFGAAAAMALLLGTSSLLAGVTSAQAAVGDQTQATNPDWGGGSSTWSALWGLSNGTSQYCLQIDRSGPETSYEGFSVKYTQKASSAQVFDYNRPADAQGKINWILQRAYPYLTISEVSAITGINGLDSDEVIDATQTAIHYYGDSPTVDASRITTGADARALYNWYVSHAVSVSPNGPNDGSISLTRASTFSQAAGGLVGPYVVHTDQVQIVHLSASGGRVVNAAGAAVSTVTDGASVYLAPTGAGPVTLIANGTYVYVSGNVWDPQPGQYSRRSKPFQQLTTAEAKPRQAQISDTPTPPPAPTVATTAVDKADGDHTLPATGGTITDTVTYTGLTPGTKYTLNGELMDKT
ncbi:VaFE repeat-containing surface-anchored protein, partial [Oerskovia jenensis]